MKKTTRDLLIVVLCFYFAYVDIKMLVELPFAEWEFSQFLLAVVALGLVAAGGVSVRNIIRELRNRSKEPQEEQGVQEVTAEGEAPPAPQPVPPPEAPPALAPEEDDLADMDDLSDLEGIELLGIRTVIPDTLDEDDEEESGEA